MQLGKKRKPKQYKMKKRKSLVSDDMIIYIEDTKDFTPKFYKQ